MFKHKFYPLKDTRIGRTVKKALIYFIRANLNKNHSTHKVGAKMHSGGGAVGGGFSDL